MVGEKMSPIKSRCHSKTLPETAVAAWVAAAGASIRFQGLANKTCAEWLFFCLPWVKN
jgi:hypothetical protein